MATGHTTPSAASEGGGEDGSWALGGPASRPGRSEMTEDYLKVIHSAQEWGGRGISVTDLAAHMGVVASTASENVRRLTDQGLVSHEPYQKVHLTERGRALAIAMVRRHRLLETYLFEKLGFDWDEVHREAEILEHAVSDALLEHLDRALGYPFRDPHGDPIPAADGTWVAPARRALDDLPPGEPAPVVRISDSRSDTLRHLDGLGIVLDSVVEVVERSAGLGTTRIRVTPPPTWHPRERVTPAAIGAGASSLMVDLGPVATAAVFVADGAAADPGPSVQLG